jgi:hypothetical protein
VEHPTACADRPTGALAMMKEPRCKLQHDLWLGIATHRSKDRRKCAIVTGGRHWQKGVRRSSAWPELGGMISVKTEAHASVVQVDPRIGFDKMATESGCIRLNQRHSHLPASAVAPSGAKVRGVAVVRRRPSTRCAFDVNLIESAVDDANECVTVSALMELLGSITSRRNRRLDQQMCPEIIVRVNGKVELGGEPSTRKSEVTLRVRAHRVQGDPKRLSGEHGFPVRLVARKIGCGEEAIAKFREATTEGTLVEA